MLGPLLFLIYTNDIDEVVVNKICKFADNTKLLGIAASDQDTTRLQSDFKNLCALSNEWLMLFNVEKCKVIHFGYNNTQAEYEMNGKQLGKTIEERDLGIIMQSDLKWSKQCSKAVTSANRTLGMIKKSFCYLDSEMMLCLYKSLVRPHLEYCVQSWCPHLNKYIYQIEGVQRRATTLMKSLSNESYE